MVGGRGNLAVYIFIIENSQRFSKTCLFFKICEGASFRFFYVKIVRFLDVDLFMWQRYEAPRGSSRQAYPFFLRRYHFMQALL